MRLRDHPSFDRRKDMQVDTGDAAWVLAASALVLFMTPGLALFYGGLVRRKSVLNMMMMSFAAIGVVSILWVLYGYSLSFSIDWGSGLLGNLDRVGLGSAIDKVAGTVPELAFASFQLMFAIITVALISGSIADRAKFAGWVVFMILWASAVYFPIAHWVFYFGDPKVAGDGGWIADHLGALDFAGGTVVHANAGAAALALTLVLGRRVGWPRDPGRPHNVPFVLLGAAILWFGWFGFNAGSALAANSQAAVAFMNTQVATAAAALGWSLVEKLRSGHATAVGFASGAVAGLVAITPACASVDPLGAVAVGVLAGSICALAVSLKFRFGFDDSLDVVGIHLVAGTVGALLIGLLATPTVTGILTDDPADGPAGLLYGGGLAQLGKQAVAVGAVVAYSFIITLVLGLIVDMTIGFRIPREDEITGVDEVTHAETAYDFGDISRYELRREGYYEAR
jgi:Amt family ammonium transporter